MYFNSKIIDTTLYISHFNTKGEEADLPEGFSATLSLNGGSVFETSDKETNIGRYLSPDSNVTITYYLNEQIYKSNIPVHIEIKTVRTEYRIRYKSTLPPRHIANTFLTRSTLHMPKWSSAYKNDVSMYSKIIFPIFSPLEQIFHKTSKALVNSLNNKIDVTFSTRVLDTTYLYDKATSKTVPKTLIPERELVTDIEINETYVNRVNLFSGKSDELTYPIKLDPLFNRVMLKCKEEVVVDTRAVDVNNVPYITSQTLSYASSVTTNDPLKTITDVIVHTTELNEEVVVSNYISCTDYDCTVKNVLILEGSINKNKEIDVPTFTYNNDSKCLESRYSVNGLLDEDIQDVYLIKDMEGYSKYFVTNTQDLFVLKEGKLYKGLLRKELETSMTIYPTNNNNCYVSLPTEDYFSEEDLEFTVNVGRLIDTYGPTAVYIRYVSDTETYYLNQLNEWVEEKVEKIIENRNPIYINIKASEHKYVSIEMEFNNVVFQSSVRRDTIPLIDTGIVLKDLLHNGDTLIGVTPEDTYVTLTPKKVYLHTHVNGLATFEGYDTARYEFKNARNE